MEQAISSVGKTLEDEIINAIYVGAGLTVFNQSKTLQYVSQYLKTQDLNEKFDRNTAITETINYAINNNRNNITSISFYSSPDNYFEYGLNYSSSKHIDPNWYETTLSMNGKPYIINPILNEKAYSDYISIAFKVLELNNYGVEVVLITLKTNIFQDLFETCENNPKNQTYIYGDYNEIVFSYGSKETGLEIADYFKKTKDITATKINNTTKFVISKPILKGSWNIVSVIDYNDMIKPIWLMVVQGVCLAGICILSFGFFAFILFRSLLIPINKISTHMQIIQNGNLIEMKSLKGINEIKKLVTQFNIMIQELRSSIQEREHQQKEKALMEIKVLQSQIMPHFIINTLNCIKLMAVINHQQNIVEMTSAFMKLLDATLSKSGDFITIKEEIENLENYIYIVKFRYGENFEHKIIVDNTFLSCSILRLLLQPIVENAVIHGFRELSDHGQLIISFSKYKNNIYISIKDNGIGMTQSQIDELLSQKNIDHKKYSHIGINNVNQRLKLHYGDAYGITIHSQTDSGTEVIIVYPYNEYCQEG